MYQEFSSVPVVSLERASAPCREVMHESKRKGMTTSIALDEAEDDFAECTLVCSFLGRLCFTMIFFAVISTNPLLYGVLLGEHPNACEILL